jgi:aminopeptidase-like protein
MTVAELARSLEAEAGTERAAAGAEMHALMTELYPIGRSITGDGIRATLKRVAREIPLTLVEVPTGTAVFDWTVPREWNVRDAYVANARGERVIDYRRSSLHLVGYSVPLRARMTLDELRPHLYTLPDHPDWVPFRTSYYRETWGFCLSHDALTRLDDGEYEVVIDATLRDGSLTYGEWLHEGERPEEILVSTHCCHPALANDNLSGIALATALGRRLAACRTRYSYRFLFIPGTIGSITWLARNEATAGRIAHGLVVTCVGDRGPLTYKRTRRGDAELDRAVVHVLRQSGRPHEIVDFFPWGYDERQYSSPGFDLAVGSLSRTPHGKYPEYHTSADDLGFVAPEALADSLHAYLELLAVLEGNQRYVSTNPKCEPQLGKRGLYRAVGGQTGLPKELPLLWVLNLADGRHSLLDVAERAGLPFAEIRTAADALVAAGLLVETPRAV